MLQNQSVRGHAFKSGTFNKHSELCHQCLTHAFSSFFAFTMQLEALRSIHQLHLQLVLRESTINGIVEILTLLAAPN